MKKGKFFSVRKRLRLGLGRVGNRNQIKYSDLLPLNQLWLQYMREMLSVESFASIPENPSSPNWENVNLQLMKADFHGAKISIDRSKCPSLVGVAGIVIQDTKNTFRVCGTDNVIRSKRYVGVHLPTFSLSKHAVSIITRICTCCFYIHWHNKFLVNIYIYISILLMILLFPAIPKDAVKINIYLDDGVTLKAFGRELSLRPAERAVKKFKNSSIMIL